MTLFRPGSHASPHTLGFAVCLGLFACGDDTQLSQLNPDLVATPNPLTFDAVPQGFVATRIVTVTNEGQGLLKISGADLTDDAGGLLTMVDPATTPIEVAPNEATELRIALAGSSVAETSGVLTIDSNDRDTPRLEIPIQVTRREGPAVTVCLTSDDIGLSQRCGLPADLSFGDLQRNNSVRARIDIVSVGTDPLEVTALDLTDDSDAAFTFEADLPTDDLAPGEKFETWVTFTPGAEGNVSGALDLFTNDPRNARFEVPLSGRGIETGLCVDPAVLTFQGVPTGQTVTKTVQLYNCGEGDLTLQNVASTEAIFTVDNPPDTGFTLPPSDQLKYLLEVTFAPTENGDYEGRIRVETGRGLATVALLGSAAACRLEVTPQQVHLSMDFNPFQTVLVSSAGSATCLIERYETTGPQSQDFDVWSELPFRPGQAINHELPPGQSLQLEVSYRPFGIGQSSTATLAITYREVGNDDASANRTKDISLTGSFEPDPRACETAVQPAQIQFGVVPIGSRRVSGTMANNSSGNPGCIESIELAETSSSSFSVQIENRGFGTGAFVAFEPTSPGPATGTLVIRTISETTPIIEVPISAFAGSPGICVNPRNVDFGDVQNSATQSFQIAACADQTVTVSSLEFSEADAEFEIANTVSLPLTLSPGDTANIEIRYTPTDNVGDTAILTVGSDDIAQPNIDVRITGGRELVPPEAGRFLYYWQIADNTSVIARSPLQGELQFEQFVPSVEQSQRGECAGCHTLSPDGRYLAYSSEGGFGFALSVVDTETENQLVLPVQVEDGLYVSWNPEVNTVPPYQFAYAANGDIHIASLFDGYLGPVAGASEPNRDETMPSWGPDGQIAFVVGNGGGIIIEGSSEIYLVNEAGGQATPLAGASGGNMGRYYPSYAPNGQWIALTESMQAGRSLSAADARIRLIAADQSGTVLPLANANDPNGGPSSYPTWSIDGRFISFASQRSDGLGSWDLYIAPIDPETGADEAAFPIEGANTPFFEHAAEWSP